MAMAGHVGAVTGGGGGSPPDAKREAAPDPGTASAAGRQALRIDMRGWLCYFDFALALTV